MTPRNKYNSETASLYAKYAATGIRYRKVAQALVEAAGDITDQSVVDLGCGTGLLTAMLSRAVGPLGEVTGVDASRDMLIAAKDNVTAQNVKFVHSPIEDMDSLIGKRVDAAFSSAAFWQFDQKQALEVLNRLLKPHGNFFFNLSGGFFDFKRSDLINPRYDNWPYVQSTVMQKWIKQCHEQYPGLVSKPEPLHRRQRTISQLREEFASHGFELVSATPLFFEIPRNDELQWLSIPQWTERPLSGIDYDQRLEVLHDIFRDIPANATFIGKWATLHIKKITNLI